MNYAELVDLVQEYVENDEATFVANIPTYVENAEKRIFHAANLPANQLNKTSTIILGNPYITLPTDFLYAQSLSVATSLGASQYFLIMKEVEYIREAYPDPTATGLPKYYAVFDSDTVIVGPTPDSSYTVELHYMGYPESIITASTTWIGDNFPHVLLYGSLVEAYTFMKGEKELLDRYDTLFKEGLLMLKQYGEGRVKQENYRR